MNITLELISANGQTVGLLISYTGQITFSFELPYRQRNTLPVMERKIEKPLTKTKTKKKKKASEVHSGANHPIWV